ncbi:hypothetical protein GY654_02260 [Vibrio parahaemolyticus]|nr:hypothetical protein [Vibrio parahaemolyticus]
MANKIIVKNSLILIIRLALTLFISLLSSKILLSAYGVEIFGIFNVTLGIVLLMGFLHGALTSAFQRYFSYYNLFECYSILIISVKVIFKISLFLLVLNLTLGLWFVSSKLNVPEYLKADIIHSYIYVTISFIFTLMVIPFQSLLISQNNAVLYSYCTLLDGFLKIISAVIVFKFELNIVTYSKFYLLSTIMSFLVSFFITYPLIKKIKDDRKNNHDENIKHELNSYILWSVWGNLASALSNYGGNILINLYFLPVFNASRVVSTQLSGVINSGINSMQLSLTPTIVRLYAKGEINKMLNVSYRASRIYLNLCALIVIPFYYYSENIMNLWLSNTTPEYSSQFFRLALLILLVDSVSPPLMICAQATGNIKKYQVIIGGLLLFVIPVTWGLYSLGSEAKNIYVVIFIFSILCLISRLLLLRDMVGLKITIFFKSLLFKTTLNVFVFFLLFYLVKYIFGHGVSWFFIILIYVFFGMGVFILAEMTRSEKKNFKIKLCEWKKI